MSETYEDEHGVWEIRQDGGRTTTILIHPVTPKTPKAKKGKGAKKGAKKNASTKKGN